MKTIFLNVSFIVREKGEVCGYISIPDERGIYSQFAVIPESKLNQHAGYTSIKLVGSDDEVYDGPWIDVYGHHIQSTYEEEDGELTDILDIRIFLNEKAD